MNPLTLVHFAAGLPPDRARRVLEVAISAAEAEADPLSAWRRRAALAFEADLHATGRSLAAALHAGTMEALRGFLYLLPGLMREANRAPSLAVVLAQAMACSLVAHADVPIRSADGVAIGNVLFSEDPVVTAAMEQWRSREVFETDLSSAELRSFSAQLKNRSVFSARTTNADYLKKVHEVVGDMASGKIGMAEGRVRCMRELKVLGYDPATSFPQDMASIPPAERGSLQDLSSFDRINLVLETNVRMAQGFSQVIAGNCEYARHAYPAWELVRLYHRETPRGTLESKSPGWVARWNDAGSSVNWKGTTMIERGEPMVALKDSPVWQALGDGEGGYTDTLLNPFPPFAFRSGMAWAAVDRARVVELGAKWSVSDFSDLADGSPAAVTATLTPGQKEVTRIVEGMPDDLRAELERELGL